MNTEQFDIPFAELKALLRSKDDAWIESWSHFRQHLPVKVRNLLGFEQGVRQDWWEDWNESAPIPFPKSFSIAELGEGATTANIVVALGLFPSITQARKNGFNGPLQVGTVEFTKRKIRAKIVP